MDKKDIDLARSIITSALTPNNKTGMTATELELEIEALMGEKLKLPPGCPGLDAFIKRFFSDEFIGTPTSYGEVKYRLIPKADTDYLLRLVAKQDDKGSKPMYVAQIAREQALRGQQSRGAKGGRGAVRGTARGGASSRGRNTARSAAPPRTSAISRLGPSVASVPPLLLPSNPKPPARPATAMSALPSPAPLLKPSTLSAKSDVFFPTGHPAPKAGIPSTFGKAFQKAMDESVGKRPASAMGQVSNPAPVAISPDNWGGKFRDLFARYKSCKEDGLALDLTCRMSHTKQKLASTDFPLNIDELYSVLSAMISQVESQNSPKLEANGDIGLLAPNSFPPVGRKITATVHQLVSLDKFMLLLQTPTGKQALLPCALYNITLSNMPEAVKLAKEAISACDNQVIAVVKTHKTSFVEVELFHATKELSLTSFLVKKGVAFAKPEVSSLPLPRSASVAPSMISMSNNINRVLFKTATVVPTQDLFVIRVSAVISAAHICANLNSNLQTLIDLDKALEDHLNVQQLVNFEEVVENACFIIRSTSRYCRARVLTVDRASGEIRLRLIDHGGEGIVLSVEELYHVPSHVTLITDTPPLAFDLDLHYLQHHIFQKDSCTAIVEEELQGKRFEARVVDRSGKWPQVNIFPLNPSTGAAVENSTCVNKLLKQKILSDLRKCELPTGEDIPVTVCYIDWNNLRGDLRLHVQVRNFGQEVLAGIEQQLPKLFEPGSKLVSRQDLSLEQEYAAPFEGAFYRCNLLSTDLDARQRAQVFFYDYGNVENVSLENLRTLSEEFSSEILCNQARTTKLHSLPPPGKQWSSGASDLLFQVFNNEMSYFARVLNRDEEENCYAVEFISSNGESLNQRITAMTELFDDAKLPSSNSESLVSLSSKPQVSAIEVPMESTQNFGDATTSLPAFNIEKSFNEDDESINACIVTFVSPSLLSCQLIPNDEFNEMISEMNEFYLNRHNQIPPAAPLKPGDVGVAYFEECFCRAQVQSTGKFSYRVNFIDYATPNQIIKHEFMFLLETRFASIPAVAFELKIDGVDNKLEANPAVVAYGQSLAAQNAFVRIYPSSPFSSSEPCDAIVSVSGRAVLADTNEDIGVHMNSLTN